MRLGFERYCDKCTSVDIDKTDIFSWQEMYKSRYGENYLNNGNKQKEWQKNVAFKMAQSK